MREWLLVDGYNVINNWREFKKLREDSLADARALLCDQIAEYCAFKGHEGVLVFDAQEVQGEAVVEKIVGITVVYTDEGETADAWIERRAHELKKCPDTTVFVVTSDYAEQINVLGSGAYRISAREFRQEYLQVKKNKLVLRQRQ